MKTADMKKQLLSRPEKEKTDRQVSRDQLLSTGSTLLNLASTGRTAGGFRKGKYYFLVGDSESGKTALSMTCLAEASISPHFDSYRFVYDNTEDGMNFPIRTMFGKGVAKRLEPPQKDKKGNPVYSSTTDDFYFNLDDALDCGPCIYILDSQDALLAADERQHFESRKQAAREGTKAKGTYGMGKAKANSRGMAQILPKLRDTGSILIIVSQTRDNVDQFSMEKKTRSGGRALKFYATVEMWSSIVGSLKSKVKGQDIQVGHVCRVKVKKNRHTGGHHSVDLPIYRTYGIDDIGSMIDFLLAWKHWKKSAGLINAHEFNVKLRRSKLIAHVEEQDLLAELKVITAEVWQEIEEDCRVKRRPRYQ